MDENKKVLVEKFMNMRFGNLVKSDHKSGQYISLQHPDTNKKIFLYEIKHDIITFNRNYVTEPILKIFKTEYNETFEYVKKWILEKYEIDCIDVVALN
jgi:hypothetical protein